MFFTVYATYFIQQFFNLGTLCTDITVVDFEWGIRGIQWSQPVSDILSAVLSLPVAVAFLKGLPEDGVEV